MNWIEHHRRQFAYDAWANREVWKAIAGARNQAKPLALLAHIVSAERLWLERVKGEKLSLPVWPEFDLEQCGEQITDMKKLWQEYLVGVEEKDLARVVQYRNSQGQEWSNSVDNIAVHVVMHSAYHRGQIAMAMRASGETPAYTDFIHAVRQGMVE